ncbi:carbohydrate porin [Congregibacter brevis]|uniref:Carbohydrate porin n=1 Tax=Congregibacter brevis TaxID=3081201 RepID=A0ABZ0I8W2_9GAMM|nr:carbohydrate porin [Congregibacter sp. IMCC45268]
MNQHWLTGLAMGASATCIAAGDLSQLTGPEQVTSRLEIDAEVPGALINSEWLGDYFAWKKTVKERTGLSFGGDYSNVFLSASDSLGEDSASGGMYRLFGSWDLTGDSATNGGSLVFKVEHRHAYGNDIPPSALGFETGYTGFYVAPFSDQGTRLTNLYWRQRFADGRWALTAGFVDVTDYLDVYSLASPWTGFMNLAMSTGSASIPVPNEGLGVAIGGYVSDTVYVIAGFADTNSDPAEPGETVDSFFDEAEYFKHVEIGWNPNAETAFLDNIHLTLWQVDERVEVGEPDGWGANISFSTSPFDNEFTTFVRGGYAEDGGSLLELSLTTGFAWQTVSGGNQLGVAYNWGRPNETTWGPELDDQQTVEAFYRIQLFKEFALTPDIQYVKNPANNPEEDDLWIIGLRARFNY